VEEGRALERRRGRSVEWSWGEEEWHRWEIDEWGRQLKIWWWCEAKRRERKTAAQRSERRGQM
jgi:hypothetical protein